MKCCECGRTFTPTLDDDPDQDICPECLDAEWVTSESEPEPEDAYAQWWQDESMGG